MNVAAVESTTLLTVAYDDSRKLLELEFCSRAIYQYFGVPAAVHQGLLRADSKGRYFNHMIRGRFPYGPVSKNNAAVPQEGLRAEWRR